MWAVDSVAVKAAMMNFQRGELVEDFVVRRQFGAKGEAPLTRILVKYEERTRAREYGYTIVRFGHEALLCLRALGDSLFPV